MKRIDILCIILMALCLAMGVLLQKSCSNNKKSDNQFYIIDTIEIIPNDVKNKIDIAEKSIKEYEKIIIEKNIKLNYFKSFYTASRYEALAMAQYQLDNGFSSGLMYEMNIASLNEMHDSIVKEYDNIINYKDSIIHKKDSIIDNYKKSIINFEYELQKQYAKNNEIMVKYSIQEKQIKNRNWIIAGEGVAICGLICGLISKK